MRKPAGTEGCDDPLLDEVREIRAEWSAKFDHNILKLCTACGKSKSNTLNAWFKLAPRSAPHRSERRYLAVSCGSSLRTLGPCR